MKRTAMTLRIFVIAILLSTVAIKFSAHAAATPVNPGDRCPELSGGCVLCVNQYDLAQQQGEWVLVEFLAGWCGPCKKQLPELLALTRPYREQGKLELVLVSLESERAEWIKRYIRHDSGLGIHWIIAGGGPQVIGRLAQGPSVATAALDWNIYSVPSAFLLDPQGTVAFKQPKRAELAPMLDYFLGSEQRAIAGIRLSYSPSVDSGMTVLVQTCSPTHEPLQLVTDYRMVQATIEPFGAERIPISRDEEVIKIEGSKVTPTIYCGEFGDVVSQAMLDLSGYAGVMFQAKLLLPDSETEKNPKGLWQTQELSYYSKSPAYSIIY